MPRQARLDYAGTLHHVICRGVGRTEIFKGATDYKLFIEILSGLVNETKASCLAWALMPNHFHLLVVTGADPLAHLMQRLLTRYAVNFNLRHHRNGHLFQNRYKSIICEKESYLLELVRYIHLNPVRAGIVDGMEGLALSPITGHASLIGKQKIDWQDTEEVLSRFGDRLGLARKAYEKFVAAGIGQGKRDDLVGGGLVRSSGTSIEYLIGRRGRKRVLGDTRVLGSGDFVAEVRKVAEERERRKHEMGRTLTPKVAVEELLSSLGLTLDEIRGNNHGRRLVQARSMACKRLVDDMGLTGRAAGEMLGMTPSAVARGVIRGREYARKANNT